ncbi:peptidylprolyl isomerase [Cypionkella sp.]|uniref:peptidylprolyl isomerase n=1 Tax=Cypionkella sp. TaxID=2811411 RepID=UPI00375286DE
MTHSRAVFRSLTLASAIGLGLMLPLQAGPFSAVKIVNSRSITQFEYDQRLQFMTLLSQPGNLQQLAMDTLIDDRLRQSAASQFGIKPSAAEVQTGMEEFASRANLDAAKFIEIIGEAGIEPQTFRDFVETSLSWREVVRAKYGPRISISEAAIDRAMASYQPSTTLMLRMSVIEIPAQGETRETGLKIAQGLLLQLKSGVDFATLARENSKGATASQGGALDWAKLSDLPDDAALAVRSLPPGGVSELVVLDDKVLIYRVEEQKQDVLTPKTQVLDYAELLLQDDAGAIASARASVGTCNDLYALAKGLPEDRLTRQTLPLSQVPKAEAAALSLLDAGEVSTDLTRNGYRVFLMLCRRGPAETELPTRDEIRLQLVNQQLGTQAQIYLEELRSEAILRTP